MATKSKIKQEFCFEVKGLYEEGFTVRLIVDDPNCYATFSVYDQEQEITVDVPILEVDAFCEQWQITIKHIDEMVRQRDARLRETPE